MNYPFSQVIIIYNPNSTGDSAANAKKLTKQLKAALPASLHVDLTPTEHAGHAEELAKTAAKHYTKPLIVSASGDGGYNEVVNGVIASRNKTALVMVLPSGNANDHHRAVGDRDPFERITNTPRIQIIDAIQVKAMIKGKDWTRFAHSYVGLGLTAHIGRKLTEADLNPLKEKWLVLKYMVLFRNVRLRIAPDLRWHHYSSVIFSNIDRMSKVIKLAPEAHLKDDRIEMYVLRSRSLIRMIFSLVFASTIGLRPTAQIESQAISAEAPVDIQLDGEVETLDAHKEITISVAKDAIRTLC